MRDIRGNNNYSTPPPLPPSSAPSCSSYRYLAHRQDSPNRGGYSVTSVSDVCDRTVVRVHRSGVQPERIRVVCTTRRQHISRLVTVSDVCHTLPPLRKHVTVIRFDFYFNIFIP